MNTLGSRLKHRRESLGLTQDQVAEAVVRMIPGSNFRRVTVSNLESEIQLSVKDKVLIALVKVLNCSPEWLVNGIGPVEQEHITALQDLEITVPNHTARRCPILDWAQVTELATYAKTFDPNNQEFLSCPVESGPNTVALRVKNDLMLPKLDVDDVIFVDTDQRDIIHGKFVIVGSVGAEEPTIKQTQLIDKNILLKITNPDYPQNLRYTPLDTEQTILALSSPVSG